MHLLAVHGGMKWPQWLQSAGDKGRTPERWAGMDRRAWTAEDATAAVAPGAAALAPFYT